MFFATNGGWKAPGTSSPARGDASAPLDGRVQCCRVSGPLWAAMGAQGGHILHRLRCRSVGPLGSWARGDVKGTAVVHSCIDSTERVKPSHRPRRPEAARAGPTLRDLGSHSPEGRPGQQCREPTRTVWVTPCGTAPEGRGGLQGAPSPRAPLLFLRLESTEPWSGWAWGDALKDPAGDK